MVWFRDRFFGADTQAVGCDRSDIGCTGQKIDSVWIDASWTGRLGPVRALLQGNVLLGKADGGTGGLPAGIQPGQEYDIFAGSGIGYVELDLGIVRPFLLGVYGTADGDPRDRQLSGFEVQPQGDSTQWATDMMGHFDRSSAAGAAGLFVSGAAARGAERSAREQPLCHWHGRHAGGWWSHYCCRCRMLPSSLEPVEWAVGERIARGIVTRYSNPGTLVGSAGVRTFPLKGHEITGFVVYRGMVNNNLLEEAFAPELQAGVIRQIRKSLYYEVGGSGSGPSIRTLTSAWRGTLPLRAMAPETWRTWPTVTRDRPAGPVKGKLWR